MPNTVLRRKRRFRAWVVYWDNGEDKVAKSTGTVITLLPSRYSTNTVAKIIEALYCAYAFTYDGQFGYIVNRNRGGDRLSCGSFNGGVVINRNPGLQAVLAEDVCINVSDSGTTQIISWTDPDYYEPMVEEPRIRKVGDGQFHRFKFDFSTYVETSLT